MAIDVTTGRTKAYAGADVTPILLKDKRGEHIFLLLHSEGKSSGMDTLEEESKGILEHSILDAEGDAYTRLEGALKELNGLFKGLLLSGALKDIHAIVGIYEPDGMLHLSHAGRAEAYLVRDGSAAQITEFSRGKPSASFVHIASGPLEPRDHVVLSTQRLLRTVTPAQLAQVMAGKGDPVKELIAALENEKEHACLIHFRITGKQSSLLEEEELPVRAAVSHRRRRKGSAVPSVPAWLKNIPLPRLSLPAVAGGKAENAATTVRDGVAGFLKDLRDPKRKKRAHLFLLAGAAGAFLMFWVVIQLSLASQKSQSREELATLMDQISADLQTAENRQLTGDRDSANAILLRAEDRARQVMSNESGLYRGEALDALETIRFRLEQLNNIIRVSPRVVVNLTAKNPDVVTQGFIAVGDGEFIVYDKQNLYRVLLNTIDDPVRIGDAELILTATPFQRYQSRVFLTTGNSLIEIISGQPVTMKTEDVAGWMTGQDIETYLSYLYVLVPERNQIYRYERLSNRYAAPSEYNVNGDLSGALDMTIDGSIYVLKEGGTVVKLFRGEQRPFTIRNLPDGALDGTTAIHKSLTSGNFYFLDPEEGRVVVASADGDLGESSYIRQYIFEFEQGGDIKGFYVDPDDTRLYILDEKRLYSVDLQVR